MTNPNHPTPADLGEPATAWCCVCDATVYVNADGCIPCAEASEKHRADVKRARARSRG